MIHPADLDRLKREANLPGLLELDGVKLRRDGSGFRCSCPIHGGDNPEGFHLYRRDGAGAWLWKCFSADCGSGDAWDYLSLRHGLPFMDAARYLSDLSGFRPEGLESGGAPLRLRPAAPLPSVPMQEEPQLPPGRRERLLAVFLSMVGKDPAALAGGLEYALSRGVPAEVAQALGGVYLLPPDLGERIARHLEGSSVLEEMLLAGVLTKRGGGNALHWWDRVALLPCLSPDGASVLGITARRLEWLPGDRVGKYLHLRGAVSPYGLPALASAAKAGDPLYLVEGPFDALGAASLGLRAVALLGRPHKGDFRKLEPFLELLRDCPRVDVLADSDPGEKGTEGRILANELAAVLARKGIRSRVATLEELGFQGKDLGEAAELSAKTWTNVQVSQFPNASERLLNA